MKLPILCFFLLISCFLTAQNKIKFNLIYGVYAPQDQVTSSSETINYSQFVPVNDTVCIEESFRGDFITTTSYDAEPSTELGLEMEMKINKRWGFALGVLVHGDRVHKRTNFTFGESEMLSADTLTNKINVGPPQLYPQCDSLITNVWVNSINNDITYSNGYLMLPFNFQYNLDNDWFFIRVGGFFRTPIFGTTAYYIDSSFREEETEIGTLCTLSYLSESRNAKDFINRSQLGISTSINIRFGKLIDFEMGARKQFSNFFSNQHDARLNPSNSFKPNSMFFVLKADLLHLGRLLTKEIKKSDI